MFILGITLGGLPRRGLSIRISSDVVASSVRCDRSVKTLCLETHDAVSDSI